MLRGPEQALRWRLSNDTGLILTDQACVFLRPKGRQQTGPRRINP